MNHARSSARGQVALEYSETFPFRVTTFHQVPRQGSGQKLLVDLSVQSLAPRIGGCMNG